jgi:uncharacterized protein with HEPN domain
MQPEVLKLLVDIQQALDDVSNFTSGMTYSAYLEDAKCRADVERKFEIIGEACTRIRERFPEIFHSIDTGPQIIGFRNRLIHGYDNVDDAIVWDVVVHKLPILGNQIEKLTK